MIPAVVYAVFALAGIPQSTPVTCAPTPTVMAGNVHAYSYTNWPPNISIVLGAAECANLGSDVTETRAIAVYIVLHEADHVRIFDAGGGSEECADQALEAKQETRLIQALFRGRQRLYARSAIAVFATKESYALGCALLQVGP